MSDYEITGMETYGPTGDAVHTDDDGFRYMVDPANGGRLYLMQDGEEAEAPAEYFPDQFTPEQVVEGLAAIPPDGREEFLVKNRPPTSLPGQPEWKTQHLRTAWAGARLEAQDDENPNKTEDFEKYLKMLGGDFY